MQRNDRSANDFAWFREGDLPSSREDFFAEIAAIAALLCALLVGLVIALLPVPAQAAEAAPSPSIELTAFRVVAATPGKPEHLESAAEARVGDVIEYHAVYRNPTAAALHQVQMTVPVPRTGVEFVLDSAAPRADSASSDGRNYAALPLMVARKAADGRVADVPAPAADYHFLRWNLGDVPAGATRAVRARVTLVGTQVAAR